MGRIILDAELKARLNGLKEQLEICDEQGTPVGMVLPLAEYSKLLCRDLQIPFTEAEIEQLRQHRGGRPLPEIWNDLAKS